MRSDDFSNIFKNITNILFKNGNINVKSIRGKITNDTNGTKNKFNKKLIQFIEKKILLK